jgi:hypothetical protein
MSGFTKRLVAISALGAAIAACADLNGVNGNTVAMSAAFQTVPAGFSANSNSFDASGDDGMPFLPFDMGGPVGFDGGGNHQGPGGGDHHGPGGGDGPGHGDHHDGFGPDSMPGRMMGGGLGPEFLGGIPFGRGRGRGPFGTFSLPDSCTFDSGSGRVSCPDRTERGLTIKTSFAFSDEAGVAQAKFDSLTTNSVNVKTDVSGTRSRHDGKITSTLTHTSDRTISGLAAGKTERTVNGTAKAHEEINGTRDSVSFTAVRNAADTTTGLVIPIVDGRPTIPSAGTVIRTMSVSITPAGGTATNRSRREEVTFDGTNVVRVKVTQDGVTQNCTVTLPDRKLVCE